MKSSSQACPSDGNAASEPALSDGSLCARSSIDLAMGEVTAPSDIVVDDDNDEGEDASSGDAAATSHSFICAPGGPADEGPSSNGGRARDPPGCLGLVGPPCSLA
jgi:hypothetical protein